MDTNRPSIIYSPVNSPKKAICGKGLCENHRNKLIIVAVGVLVGFLLCMGYIVWTMAQRMIVKDPSMKDTYALLDSSNNSDNTNNVYRNAPNDGNSRSMTSESSAFGDENIFGGKTWKVDQPVRRRRLYVGVLTLEPYLDSRATVCNETWGQNDRIDKLEFYAEVGDTRSHSTVGLVDIPDTTSMDAWHTEKAFRMLEHMCRDHGNQYDWFLRAVDDSYINVDKLWSFLDLLDQTQELLLGHHTLPIDEISYKALSGRGYCIGGPGLIFSRPLIQKLCPSLEGCRQQLSHLPADVAIAKCASETIGIECASAPELHPYFVHSFDKNQFHLLDKFIHNSRAISYHPLKSTWMMRSLHEHITKSNVENAESELESLEKTKQTLQNELGDNNIQMDDSSAHQADELLNRQVSFMTATGLCLTASSCSPPSYQLSHQENQHIKESLRLANTSIRWGKFHSCHNVLSSYSAHVQDTDVLIVDMICKSLSSPTNMTLARAVMTRSLKQPYLKEQRTWKTSQHLIVVIETSFNDPHLIDFLLKFYYMSQKIDQRLVLTVIDDVIDVSGKQSKKKNRLQNQIQRNKNQFLLKDLKHWYNSAGIDMYVHSINHSKHHNGYNDALSKLSRKYPDATVLFTSVDLSFDEIFLRRCGAIVRQGRQLYSPRPSNQYLLEQYEFNNRGRNLPSAQIRPLCVHIKDYLPEKKSSRKRRNRHRGTTGRPIKVNTAVDANLRLL